VRIFYLYGLMCWKLIEIWSRLTDPRADQPRRERQRARLGALAEEYRIAVEKLEALDGLRCVPVLRRLGKILRAMFIDRVLLGFSVAVAIGGVCGFVQGVDRLIGAAAVLLAGMAANEWLSHWRLIPSEAALRRAPLAIWRIMKAPFIVFGHSHHPERLSLEGGGVYFNTGAWAEAPAGGAFTHLIISFPSGGERPLAELRQWRDGASAPYSAAG
jgi:hypothetical protein